MKCLNCGADLVQIPKKRKKEFCDSTCRSNNWQKEKRKKDSPQLPGEKEEKPKINLPPLPVENIKHPLWQEGDPKEGSLAFFNKYLVENYDQLAFKTGKR